VLFTDGEDSRSAVSLGELLQSIRSSAVTIYPIGFMGGFPTGSARLLQSRAFLQQIAEITGGQLFTPNTSKDLGLIYQKILDELTAQYVIGFVSDNLHRDGQVPEAEGGRPPRRVEGAAPHGVLRARRRR